MGRAKESRAGLHRNRTTDAGRLHRTLQWQFLRGVLAVHAFRILGEVREQAEQSQADHNTEIHHGGLGGLTTAEIRQYRESETPIYPNIKLRGIDKRHHRTIWRINQMAIE